MNRIALAIVMAAALLTSRASSEGTPFAQPGNAAQTMPHSLGDIMWLTQLRHIKLWYAGRAENWPLVEYELNQLKDTLNTAGIMYVGIPLEYIIMLDQPLTKLREAAEEKSASKFAVGYSELTGACNRCHVAGQVGFIRIQTPTTSPFSDQDFSKEKRQ